MYVGVDGDQDCYLQPVTVPMHVHSGMCCMPLHISCDIAL